MTRSSNGMTMSGAGFVGPYWRKQKRGYGLKFPWKSYVAESKLFLVRRFIGSVRPSRLSEPEDTYLDIGSFRLPELLKLRASKKINETDFIRQEDAIGWEQIATFFQPMATSKKRRKTKPISKFKKLKKKSQRTIFKTGRRR